MDLSEQAYTARLKSVPEAVITQGPVSGKFYHYEPGNGTRYEVFISERGPTGTKYDEYYPKLTIQVMNFDRPCSMTIPVFDGNPEIYPDYMCEKMGIMAGDALALISLIKHHIQSER